MLVVQVRMLVRLFVCWIVRGLCLLEGAPGLDKTLASETVAVPVANGRSGGAEVRAAPRRSPRSRSS